jgi:hypothetical protein
MSRDLENVMTVLEDGIRGLNAPRLCDVEKAINSVIDSLIDDDILDLGPDHQLGGRGLESRVRCIFREMGFIVEKGPDGYYDVLIKPAGGWKPTYPLVVEIKSGKSPSPGRHELRQLDDWVFELSGEEAVRKGKAVAPGNLITRGLGGSLYSHPTPHKGLMIYNGSLGTSFADRTQGDAWLGANEKEFAERRAFCVASLPCILEWFDRHKRDDTIAHRLWETIHATIGVLPNP